MASFPAVPSGSLAFLACWRAAAFGRPRARVLIDEADLPYRFFGACGFLLRGPQPSWPMLPASRGTGSR